MGAEDTLPKLILRNYERYGDKRVAVRKKIYDVIIKAGSESQHRKEEK